MKRMILKVENQVVGKYGFENWRTITVFKITEKMRSKMNFWD